MTTEIKIQKLVTPKGQTYWNRKGIYQNEYDNLKKLVPYSGEADTVHGEMLRCVGKLYYDYFNNGNCNAIEHLVETETHDCSYCNGSGEVSEYNEGTEEDEMVSCGDCSGSGDHEEFVNGDAFINPYFKEFVDFLKENVSDKSVIEKLEAFMLDSSNGYSHYKFDDEEASIYDAMVDEVVYSCLITVNESRNLK